MEEWEPAETPTKNAGSGDHSEDENNEQKSQFPADLFQKGAAVDDQAGEQRRWCDQATRQFGRTMWLELG